MNRSALRWVLLALVGFAVILAVRPPARWIAPLLAPAIQCESLTGTLWRGGCERLRLTGSNPGSVLALDRIGWKLHPLSLLRGRVSADLEFAHQGGRAIGRVTADSNGLLQVDSLTGALPVDRSWIAVLPQGWSSELGSDALALTLRGAQLESLRGSARLRNLRDAQGNSFGSFEIGFGDTPQKPPVTGALRDLDGPLGVQGTVRIEANGAWQIDGRITPRSQAPAALAQQLRVLGLPDASGAYPFSIAGLVE